jgi:hypothetical protein
MNPAVFRLTNFEGDCRIFCHRCLFDLRYCREVKVGAAGGEPGRLAEARIHLLEAKIRLKEEEAK